MISPESSASTMYKLADPNRGRIVAVGISPDSNSLRMFTGMGGRSAGSRNRHYEVVSDLNGNQDFLKTAVADPALQVGDPSATLYVAQRSRGGWHVASNGEQTDGIVAALAVAPKDESYEYFQKGQKLYIDEGPQNAYTPRITAAASQDLSDEIYMGKVVREEAGHDSYRAYNLVKDFGLKPGEAYLTTTYDGSGGTDTNMEEPWGFLLERSLEDDMHLMWEMWDPNTKSNLAGKEIDMRTGEVVYLLRSIHSS